MIYLTGDTHGDIAAFRDRDYLADGTLTERDYVIVTGDFGFIFQTRGTMAYLYERECLAELAEKPYTILFVDGNHENFERLSREYGAESWHGGRVHRIRPNILHLCRGQVFDIEGKSFFTMGGGYSRDKYMRREGFSWWSEEMPSGSDYRQATASLRERNMRVDYIVTHTAPSKVVYRIGKTSDPHEAELSGFFDWLSDEVFFHRWFFGHFHTDAKPIDGRFFPLYKKVIAVP